MHTDDIKPTIRVRFVGGPFDGTFEEMTICEPVVTRATLTPTQVDESLKGMQQSVRHRYLLRACGLTADRPFPGAQKTIDGKWTRAFLYYAHSSLSEESAHKMFVHTVPPEIIAAAGVELPE